MNRTNKHFMLTYIITLVILSLVLYICEGYYRAEENISITTLDQPDIEKNTSHPAQDTHVNLGG